MGKRTWTTIEENTLVELYKSGMKMEDIAKNLNKTNSAVSTKIYTMGLAKEVTRKTDCRFKADYQDYNWCYERYINQGMSMKEMADEARASLRVIQKWCSEKHRLNEWTFKKEKKLTDLQKQVIMFGKLGDGHIDKREDQPMYIESHAENQKDYLFWKWSILKDLCHHDPVYYPSKFKEFSGKLYDVQASYRLNTRIIDDLKSIRSMDIKDIIIQLNEFGLSLHMLDDGFRGHSNWQLCMADYSQEEIDLYIKICKEKFGLFAKQLKDNRYIQFDAESSRNIDKIILDNIPNDLDIVKYKILDANLASPVNYIYVNDNGNLIGLNTFCRGHQLIYTKCKKYVDSLSVNQISAQQLYDLKERNYEAVC